MNRILKTALGIVLTASFVFPAVSCGSEAGKETQANNETTKAPGTTAPDTTAAENKKYASKINVVWYPNESASDYQAVRDEFAKLITEATGKEVEQKLTTDYAIAIEAIASGTAQIAFMGAEGYIQANTKNASVQPLFVNSGASGTLDDAIYYSWFAVNKADETDYKTGDDYSIQNIQGKKMSFVSNSSTSGFKVPTNAIFAQFGKTDKWKNLSADDLIEGGSDMFFAEVLFGGSHQGSAVNLLTGKANVAAFCDTEMAPYMNLVSGEASHVGAVYEVKSGASAPFDTLVGKQCVIIQSTPVLNGPFAYNADTLSPDDIKSIQELFTSDGVAENALMFIPKGEKTVGLFKKSGKEHFVLVEDSWYNPIREMQ